MRLADAVEQWGISNRDRLDASEAELVRKVWSTLRDSSAGMIDLTELEQHEPSEIAALFSGTERAGAQRIVETATKWAGSRPERPDAQEVAMPEGAARSIRLQKQWRQEDALARRKDFGILLAAVSGAVLLVLVIVAFLILG